MACIPMMGVLCLLKGVPLILFSFLVSDKFDGEFKVVSCFWVFDLDIIASRVFKTFATSFSVCCASDMGWKVIEATTDNKG